VLAGQDADKTMIMAFVQYIQNAGDRWLRAARGVEYRIIPVGNVVRRALIGKAKVRDGDRGHMHRGRVLIARQVETMMFALTVVQGLAPGPVLGMTLAHGEAEDLGSVQE